MPDHTLSNGLRRTRDRPIDGVISCASSRTGAPGRSVLLGMSTPYACVNDWRTNSLSLVDFATV
jgi:hypothetical protein